jgi:hypothetical protein
MANVALGLPTFSGHEDEDIDSFIHLFRGYLHAIGVDPIANSARALGIFRACFKGEASIWYDEHILGKRWQLYNLYNNTGQNTIAGIRGRSMAQLNATASLRIGSEAHTYANIGANNAILVSDAGSLTRPVVNNQNLWIPVQDFDQDWSILGGRPTNDNNPPQGGGGNNRPITFNELRIGNAVYFFRNNYPTVLDDRRKVRFNSLYQDNDPIRIFYNKVNKYGKLLKLSQASIEDQFFKGMSPDSQLEADRIGPERPIDELVDSLERVEKRKSEMRLGISSRKIQQSKISQDIIPISLPPVSQQEPVILKPVTSQEITQEKLDQLLKTHTDNLMQTFQNQIQALQEKISQPVQLKVPEHYPVIPQVAPEFQPNKPYTGYEQKTDMEQLIKNIMERAEKRKWEKKLDAIVEGVTKLNINDSDDEYTTNLVYDEESGNILQVQKKK